ncbi:hypothetical protein DBR06_SOUSAS10610002, partial [Sousa chinensis]
RLLCPPENKYSVWMHISILASLWKFLHLCISKQVYEESGPSVSTSKVS